MPVRCLSCACNSPKRPEPARQTASRTPPKVEGMQGELVALQPQLIATVSEVEALMARIDHDKAHEVGGRGAAHRPQQWGSRSPQLALGSFQGPNRTLFDARTRLPRPQVEPKAAVVREEEARARASADAARAIKEECEADLAEVGLGAPPTATRSRRRLHLMGCRGGVEKLQGARRGRRAAPICGSNPPKLPQAIPILNEALAALDTIKEADIS